MRNRSSGESSTPVLVANLVEESISSNSLNVVVMSREPTPPLVCCFDSK